MNMQNPTAFCGGLPNLPSTYHPRFSCNLHNFFERSTDPFQKWFTLL